jgi:hypothetical protein
MYIDFKYTYNSVWEFRQKIKEVINRHPIDFIVPGCDSTINYFSQVLRKPRFPMLNHNKLRTLILKSCNSESAFSLLGNKSNLQSQAVRHNILNPENKHFNSSRALLKEIGQRKFPLVLKKDFGVAGKGVRICYNQDDVLQALKGFNSENSILKYWITTLISILISKPYSFRDKGIAVQNYIEGSPYMHLVFASKGEVLSSVTLLKVTCYPGPTSPSSVVKPLKHDQIAQASAKIIKESNVSGFFSFDFIVDSNNKAYLLECNPRPTPIAHLSHLIGGNLCAAMKKHLGVNEPQTPAYPEIVHEYIALFPSEIKRDSNSEYIKKGYHDIPYDDRLLLDMINEDLINAGLKPV